MVNIVVPNNIVYDVKSYFFLFITTNDIMITVYSIIIIEYIIINKYIFSPVLYPHSNAITTTTLNIEYPNKVNVSFITSSF